VTAQQDTFDSVLNAECNAKLARDVQNPVYVYVYKKSLTVSWEKCQIYRRL